MSAPYARTVITAKDAGPDGGGTRTAIADRRPIVAASLGAACISASGILVKLAGAGTATTAFYRCLLALPVLVALAMLEQRRHGRRRLAAVPGAPAPRVPDRAARRDGRGGAGVRPGRWRHRRRSPARRDRIRDGDVGRLCGVPPRPAPDVGRHSPCGRPARGGHRGRRGRRGAARHDLRRPAAGNPVAGVLVAAAAVADQPDDRLAADHVVAAPAAGRRLVAAAALAAGRRDAAGRRRAGRAAEPAAGRGGAPGLLRHPGGEPGRDSTARPATGDGE